MNSKIIIALVVFCMLVISIGLYSLRSDPRTNENITTESPVTRTPRNIHDDDYRPSFIEIEDDGDINIGGVEVFDPEDAAKAAALLIVTKPTVKNKILVIDPNAKVAVKTTVATSGNTTAIKKEITTEKGTISKKVTTTVTPTGITKVTKTKVIPKPKPKK